jgi:sugar phosphate isomerase/epimerase
MSKVGLQLYSLRELAKKNFLGTISEVGKIGYDGIEFAGFFNVKSKDVKSTLEASNLEACGSHTPINLLIDSLSETIEYNLEIDNPYIICPGLPKEMRNSYDAWKKTADLFNEIGLKCKENNIQFGFHNHYVEFEIFNGEYGLDILAKNTQKDLVCLQLDTAWVEYAGLKTIDFMKKYSDRLPVLHIKELKNKGEKDCTEIGKGIIDFKEIIELGKEYGTIWYIVEQENFDIPYFQSIKESLDYLRNII